MKQLICEMCGSKDLLKQDGVFVCQSCGCKYTIEEAKKMMIEGTVDVSGSTIKVDNSDSIDTYMSMAENAYNANNLVESETYCNKVIELEPQNYDAWLLKGQAAGWQSSLGNIRLGEAINCFLNAIKFSPEEPQPIKLELGGREVDATVDVRQNVIDKATETVKKIAVAIVKLQTDRFIKWPDDEEFRGCVSIIGVIGDCVYPYLEAIDVSESQVSIMYEIAKNLSLAVTEAIKKSAESCVRENEGRLDDYSFNEAINNLDRGILLLDLAAKLSKESYNLNIGIYKAEIKFYETSMKLCSYDYRYDSNTSKKIWYKSKVLSASSIASRKESIAKCKNKIEECQLKIQERDRRLAEEKKQKQKERNESYWAEHAEEKQQLESERDSLNVKLKPLMEQCTAFDNKKENWMNKREEDTPSAEKKKSVENQISELYQKKKALGLFKGKEKKALQEQIDSFSKQLSVINKTIETEKNEQAKVCNEKIHEIEQTMQPIVDQIDEMKKRINEITIELNKNR